MSGGTIVLDGIPFDVVSTRLRNGQFELIGETSGPHPGFKGGRCNVRLYDGDGNNVFEAPGLETLAWHSVGRGRKLTIILPVHVCEVVNECPGEESTSG